MKIYRILFLSFVLFAIPNVGLTQGDKGSIVGAWKLISIDMVNANGEVVGKDEWLGKDPIGLIIYDTSGYMSVQLNRNIKEGEGTWYYAYFGKYEVNEKEGFILHHVQGSLNPGEFGTIYKRNFKISDKRIMLTTPELMRLTFERIEK